MIIKSKLSEASIEAAVNEYLANVQDEFSEDLMQFVANEMLEQFLKFPEIIEAVMSDIKTAIQECLEYDTSWITDELESYLEEHYQLLINKFYKRYLVELKQQSDEEYENARGRTL